MVSKRWRIDSAVVRLRAVGSGWLCCFAVLFLEQQLLFILNMHRRLHRVLQGDGAHVPHVGIPLLRKQPQPLIEHSSPRLCIRNSVACNSGSCRLNLCKCYNFELLSS